MRSLVFIAIIGFLIYFITSWLKLRNMKPPASTENRNGKSEKMVRCEECGSYLPESRFLTHKEKHFCSKEHLRQHLTNDN